MKMIYADVKYILFIVYKRFYELIC